MFAGPDRSCGILYGRRDLHISRCARVKSLENVRCCESLHVLARQGGVLQRIR